MLCLFIWINLWPGPSFSQSSLSYLQSFVFMEHIVMKPCEHNFLKTTPEFSLTDLYSQLSTIRDSNCWLFNIHFIQRACTLQGTLILLKCNYFWNKSTMSLNISFIKFARSSAGRHLEVRCQAANTPFFWVCVYVHVHGCLCL